MIDGNDIWEALFGLLKGDVPEVLTEQVLGDLAACLNPSQTDPTICKDTNNGRGQGA